MFYGLMISCETDGHESKPSSKGRSRITTGGKPHRMKNSIRLVVLMGIMRLWVGLRAILPKSTCPRKNQFVAGGWNRGSALAHLQLSEVECSGGHLSGNNSREKEERREKREERREKRGGPIILAWPASAVTDHVNCGHIIIRVFWLIEI